MSRCLTLAKVLLLGLLTAQMIATLQVYLSNAGLYHSLISIKNAGYLTIPNQRIMQGLLGLGPAFFGGVFFTLSLGAGLSLLTLAAAWTWDRLFSRKIVLLHLFLVPWIGLLAGVNLKGFCPIVTSYFFFIPIIVFASTLRWLPARRGQKVWLKEIAHLIPLIMLTVLWGSQADRQLFVSLRDNLLLSNSFGMKINGFYYKYTLYPAEVFKPLDQKTLKTCRLEPIDKKTLAGLLEKRLIHYDYLVVRGNVGVDLILAEQDNTLCFKNKGEIMVETPLDDFLARPANVLKEFSLRTDRHGLFRHFTFFSLLIGFPITLYIVFYTLFCLIAYAFFDRRIYPVISGILCFGVGIALLVLFHMGAGAKVAEKDLQDAMGSARWQVRVAALKFIQKKGLEVGNYNAYKEMLNSPNIPERYWLARVLGDSREPETYRDLLVFLDDPYPNVVCMAFHSLGQRGKKRIVREIVKRIEISDHWYEQWYAYRALRTLGWKQTRSK
jgi:hypothetical protein